MSITPEQIAANIKASQLRRAKSRLLSELRSTTEQVEPCLDKVVASAGRLAEFFRAGEYELADYEVTDLQVLLKKLGKLTEKARQIEHAQCFSALAAELEPQGD